MDKAIKAAVTEKQIQMSLSRNDSNENPEIQKTLETQDMSKKLDDITAKMNNTNIMERFQMRTLQPLHHMHLHRKAKTIHPKRNAGSHDQPIF